MIFAIHGADGRMGRAISTYHGLKEHIPTAFWELKERPFERVDLIMDFTSNEGSQALADRLLQDQKAPRAILIGSTGLTQQTMDTWHQVALHHNLSVLICPNTSVGIHMLLAATKAAIETLQVTNHHRTSSPLEESGFHGMIIETHHALKKDTPSGTALAIQSALPVDLLISSYRLGGVLGEHSIRLVGEEEEVTITHKAFSRRLFAKGALQMASWLMENLEPGKVQVSFKDDLSKKVEMKSD